MKKSFDKSEEQEHLFEFSVIMPVYNVEQFMEEAVESIIHQTLGFEKIQLIMVDDGSTDSSGAICDHYKQKYPNQTIVIHKENGGQASARNVGLPHVKGKYVSFLDPDDYLDLDAFQKIILFFEQHEETDICSIPIKLFGSQIGDHPLNYKFEKGTCVLDLSQNENAECIQLSNASAFYRATATVAIRFDENLYQAEDSKVILSVLMNNPHLGLVADTEYHYRKHNYSTLSAASTERRAYLPCIQHFAKWALDTAEAKYGCIPKYIQHTVMYELQWRLKVNRLPVGVLTPEEEIEYRSELLSLISRIDDDVILRQKYISLGLKIHALRKKHGCEPTISISKTTECVDNIPVGDAGLYYGDEKLASLSGMGTCWEFATFDEKECSLTLEGYYLLCCGLEELDIRPYLIVNSKPIACEITERKQVDFCLGEVIAKRIGFRAVLPLRADKLEICPACLVGGTLVPQNSGIEYGQFFPISGEYENMRYFQRNRMLYADKSVLRIVPRPSLFQRTNRECALLLEIWKKNLLGGRKAVAGRLYYHLIRPFKLRRLWIVSDRIMKADDNGEALFCYLMQRRPKNTRVLFAISNKSPDAERVEKIGPCVNAMSFRHKLLHLLCDVNISSQADGVTVNPFSGHSAALQDLLQHQEFVFLQHGVIKDDLSDWLNRFNKNLTGFVTSAVPERESIVSGDYFYPEERIWLTGLPRFDRLYHNETKTITLMPTWREYLMGKVDGKTGIWRVRNDFEQSSYYTFYSGLLKSKRLLDVLDAYGYTLQFFPHPTLRLSGVQFQHDPRAKILPLEKTYRDIYATSCLVLTDYSSAVFDFAYLRKPIIYCQFDKKEFFAGDHVYTRGYFDYERDGFGEVEYDLESTIDRIIEYVENGCQLKPQYRSRIDGFFAFNDQNNCKRVTEAILRLDKTENN